MLEEESEQKIHMIKMAMNVKMNLENYLKQKEDKMPVNVLAPAFPLEKNEDGKYKTYSSEEITQIVDQNIKMVLLTRKGKE